MSYLIDTHCHLHDREFFSEKQAEEMLKRASARGVKQIICIGTSHEDSLAAQKFAAEHENVFWTYGIHPEAASDGADGDRIFLACSPSGPHGCGHPTPTARSEPGLTGVRKRTRFNASKILSPRPVAVGEVGLDYHYPGYDREAQIKLLEEMIQLAVDNDLPCSFHVREAFEDFYGVVKNFVYEARLKCGVLHSFSDSEKNFWRALDLGNIYIGVNGLATFANLDYLKSDEINAFFVYSRCVLETDAPFLTPEPNRGKINEPGNVKDVATWLAKKFEISETEVAEWTTKNARLIFNLPDSESATGAASA